MARTSDVATARPDVQADRRPVAPSLVRVPSWTVPVAVGAATVTLVAALVLGGGRPERASAGLPDSGAFTGWALPVARWCFDVAALGTVGMLLTGAVLLPGVAGLLSPVGARAVRAAMWWSLAWSLGAVASAVLSLSDIVGMPVSSVLSGGVAPAAAWELPQVRAMVVVAVLAAVVALASRVARGVLVGRALTAFALVGLLPPVLTGHSSSAPDHDLASSSLLVHVVAATLWIGGLLGLLLHGRRAGEGLPAAVRRYSTVALCCLLAVGGSGLLNAWLRLGDSVLAWGSGYVQLGVLKVLALVALAAFGWQHRRRTIPSLVAGRPRAFVRWAAVELAAMAAAVALAVALSRTPTPTTSVQAAVPSHGAGHPVLGASVEPFEMTRLLTEWRLDAAVLTVVALALAGYLSAVRRLAARGQRWPWVRSAAAVGAAGMAVFALCGGMAEYSVALLSVQVAQLLTLLLVVPGLVALSAPVSLVLSVDRAGWQPPRVVSALADPVNGVALVMVLLAGVYATPLLEASLRHVSVHRLVDVLALAVGLVAMWSLVGVDPAPGPRRSGRDRAVLALLLAVVLIGFGVLLVLRDDLLAGAWFSGLRWAWADPVVDQRRAAGVVWAFAQVVVPVLLMVVYLQAAPPVRSRRR